MAIQAADPSGDEGGTPAGTAASAGPRVSPIAQIGQDLPLVSAAVLQDMEEQLGRLDIAWNFANDYASMWAERQRCLVDAVQRADRSAALDAAISLKVSSAMVGGLRLARLAEALESTIREGEPRDGAPFLAMISVSGPATVKELQLGYLRKIR